MSTVNPTFMLAGITIYADGGCTNNGASDASAYGSFLVTKNGVKVESSFDNQKVVQHKFEYGKGTNNTAELMTLKHALTYCRELVDRGYTQGIALAMDSRLAINAAAVGVKKPQDSLRPLYKEVYDLARSFDKQVTLVWVPNEAIKMILGH